MMFTVILFVITAAYASVAAYADEAEPHIPKWISNFTQYYADGQMTTEVFTETVRYLLDAGVIYLGDPPADNPEIINGTVTRNVDGNTIYIDDVNIRIPLVDVEDSGNYTMPHAVLAKLLCPVGSPAQYDIDDKQRQDKYERTIAVVYCNTELHLGEIMIGFGLGWINDYYCDKSEFEFADWTHGSCWH